MTSNALNRRRGMMWTGGAVLAFALGGCSTTEQVQTFVRDAYVNGPVMSPPVHVVTDGTRNTLTISAYATAQRGTTLRGTVDGAGSGKWRSQWDTLQLPPGTTLPLEDTRSQNMFWYTPEYAGGVHFDVAWESFGLSFGGMLASHNGSTRVGWNAGIGFFSRESSAVRLRADIGLFGQSMNFVARSMTITTTSSQWWGGSSQHVDTAFYFDKSTESGLGYYGSLTINTAYPRWPVNLFLQVHCVVQPLLSYTPFTRTTVDWALFIPIETQSGSGEVTTSAMLLGLTPGIYVEPSPSSVLVAGVRVMADVSGTLRSPDYVVMPFVQFGLRVGL